jgi:hypothetical protein
MEKIKMTPQEIANELLDQWACAHRGAKPDYKKLSAKYAAFVGTFSSETGTNILDALHAGRVARGWPEPKPAPPGFMSIEPTIEAAIMALLISGLQALDQDLAEISR